MACFGKLSPSNYGQVFGKGLLRNYQNSSGSCHYCYHCSYYYCYYYYHFFTIILITICYGEGRFWSWFGAEARRCLYFCWFRVYEKGYRGFWHFTVPDLKKTVWGFRVPVFNIVMCLSDLAHEAPRFRRFVRLRSPSINVDIEARN